MPDPIRFGPFLLVDRVAIGGMAEVFAAVKQGDARLFAVKRILPTLAEDDELVRMFLDEARVLAHLEHPGIVPVHEAGRWPNGAPYYVMKLVEGRTLKELEANLRDAYRMMFLEDVPEEYREKSIAV